MWVTATREAVAKALAGRAFARSLKRPVTASKDLAEQVEALLARAARDSLSLANKAGLVTTGFDKVEKAIGRGGIEAVLHASDAASDGMRKVGQALRRRFGDAHRVEVVKTLSSSELGVALGRDHVIHAVLDSGAASRACVERCRVLEHYRIGGAAQGAPLRRGDEGPNDAGEAWDNGPMTDDPTGRVPTVETHPGTGLNSTSQETTPDERSEDNG